MTTFVVDVHEERLVAITDVVGTYINTLMNNFLAMKLEGKMVDYMVQANPNIYAKHVRIKYGKNLLYLRIVKALYKFIKLELL